LFDFKTLVYSVMSLIKEARMINMMSPTLPLVATNTFVWANGNSKFLLVRISYKAVSYQAGSSDWSRW